jgi:undecaprenyl-diphosphatase
VLTYAEMIVVGLLEDVSELFPVSSLGHGVLVPALIGGSWGRDLGMSASGSPYLVIANSTRIGGPAGVPVRRVSGTR